MLKNTFFNNIITMILFKIELYNCFYFCYLIILLFLKIFYEGYFSFFLTKFGLYFIDY